MSADLLLSAWPEERVGEALEALARKAGLSPRPVELPAVPGRLRQSDGGDLRRWIEAATAWLGLEAEAVEAPFADVGHLLRAAGPALLRLPSNPARFVALLGGRGGRLRILCPDLTVRRLPLEEVRSALCAGIEVEATEAVDKLLTKVGVEGRRLASARRAIVAEQLGPARIFAGWVLRLPPGASFFRELRQAKATRHLVTFVSAHLVQYLAMLGAWWMVGRGALQGRLDPGLLIAWALLLMTLVPVRMLMSWAQGIFAIDVGQVLKKRLLYGALRLEPEEIRNQGAGQHLGRVIESSAVGSLALAAGFSGVMAVVEIVMAAAVLSMGSGGLLHSLLLALWAGLTAAVVYRYYRQTLTWTDNRLEMTHDLVERMVGHRTRLAQEEPRRWHDGEDEALERHLALSMGMDRTSLRLSVWLARGWMLVGLAGLAPAFVGGAGTAGLLAVGLGGVILASRALGTLESSLASLSAAAVAWRQASLLFKAASRPKPFTSPSFVAAPRQGSEEEGAVIDADDVVFRYRDRGEPVLRGCSLEVRAGDRVLLEGPSGGGKSTLVSVLTGLREPESGLILLRGLDRQTIGADGWRRLVATAPQFQENHVLTATFAFNLLMGRRWPAPNEDLAEAEEVCRDLGLGPLLDRMPAGLQQTVGETGWRLSHGEQSRLFIARALLQDADLVVLDESFAALDPESLELAMSSALKRSKSLLVVAHP